MKYSCSGPHGRVTGSAHDTANGARAAALGAYGKRFGRDALTSAKGRLTLSPVGGSGGSASGGQRKTRRNPAPKAAASKPAPARQSNPKGRKSGQSAELPNAPRLTVGSIKDGARGSVLVLVIGKSGRAERIEAFGTITAAKSFIGGESAEDTEGRTRRLASGRYAHALMARVDAVYDEGAA